MRKSKKVLFLFAVVVLILAVFFAVQKYKKFSSDWNVVYLSTGEIYIGKISSANSFSKFKLSDAYLLQVVKSKVGETEEIKTNFQLTPLNEALWSPKELYVNRKQVVFYGPIDEASNVAEAIRNADKE